MCVSTPKFICWKPTSQYDGIRRWCLWKVIRNRWSDKPRSLMNGISVLTRITVTICSDFGAQQDKVYHCFQFPLSICHEVMGWGAMILVFWMLNFKPPVSFYSFTFINRLHSSSSLSTVRVISSAYLRLLRLWTLFLWSGSMPFSLILLPLGLQCTTDLHNSIS